MDKILNRSSNSVNIATFWENYKLKKYNFDPPYQREGDVWNSVEQSYLIDTILKNFPMPPIFLHQHIDNDTGKTIYDVVDGKQRLTAVVSFLENETAIPEDFADDEFGDKSLSGLYFKELDVPSLSGWKKNFWQYEISVEYVSTDDEKVVNHIFDRLNRNGEPLTAQELRNAKYSSSYFYKKIKKLSKNEIFNKIVEKLKTNRLEHHEFISELLFLVSEDKVLAGDRPEAIDALYESYSKKGNDEIDQICKKFNNVANILNDLDLVFDEPKFYGVSHAYGQWGVAWKLEKEGKSGTDVQDKIQEFYRGYKNKAENKAIEDYRITMSAGTKSPARRKRRIDALLGYILGPVA